MDHEKHMRLAIEAAKNNSDSPFGAVIVDRKSGEVLATAFNAGHENPVRHAETAAIYDLAEKVENIEWDSLVLYTTAEPCPMCAGAILWSGIGRVFIGTSIRTLSGLGLPQINVPIHYIFDRASEDFNPPKVEFGMLEAECNELYRKLAV